MKKIPHMDKGILNTKYKVNFMGLNLVVIQIILGVIRERRVIEFLWGGYCFLRYRPSKLTDYFFEKGEMEYSLFFNLRFNSLSIISRTKSINNKAKVYGEYGQPGAKLIYVQGEAVTIFDPYVNDPGVYHIHNIISIGDDRYLISTGDSNKYLDEFYIDNKNCKRIKRHLKHLGGFTSSVRTKETVFMGTDFSHRPNYLLDIKSGKKYFLPKQAWLEYIIKIEAEKLHLLTVVTKCLNDNKGHKLAFCTLTNKFLFAKKVFISEVVLDETI